MRATRWYLGNIRSIIYIIFPNWPSRVIPWGNLALTQFMCNDLDIFLIVSHSSGICAEDFFFRYTYHNLKAVVVLKFRI